MKKLNELVGYLNKIAPYIAIALLLLCLSNCTNPETQSYRSSPAQFKKVKVGFSLGTTAGVTSFGGLLEMCTKYGMGYFRVYEPFVKGSDTLITPFIQKVIYLNQYKKARVLISLAGIPHSWLNQHDTLVLTSKQRRLLTFTNRFYPKDTTAYKRLLTRTMDSLQVRGLLPYVDIETGDEEDAANYFWGYKNEDNKFNAFKSLNEIKLRVLQKYPVKIAIGSYTCSTLLDSSAKNKSQFVNYIDQSPVYTLAQTTVMDTLTYFSHSFYWNSSIGDYNINKNNYPTRKLKTWVTEYGPYSSIPNKTTDSIFNNQYAIQLCKFLMYIYDKPIERIYIHTLCDNPWDKSGDIALWQKISGNHYVQKTAWLQFWAIYQVFKDDYYVIPNGIVGRTKTFLIQGNTFNIYNN